MKKMIWVFLLAFGLILSWTVGIAGDFYVVPVKGQYKSWDTKIAGATRFKLILDGEAVLDRETGLVWEKETPNAKRGWQYAIEYCYMLNKGGRKGWRVPTIEELASLVDPGKTYPSLPDGHPFTCPDPDYLEENYWSSTTYEGEPDKKWVVFFANGYITNYTKTGNAYCVRCVRGGYGYNAR